MSEHGIIDVSDEHWEEENCLTEADYELIMGTARQLEEERAQRVSDWAWMSMGYGD